MSHHWVLGAEQPSSDAITRYWLVRCDRCGREQRLGVTSPNLHVFDPASLKEMVDREVTHQNQLAVCCPPAGATTP